MGGKQLGFSDYGLTMAKKQTKRKKFFSEMELGAGCYSRGWFLVSGCSIERRT
jgi:hypothetical protein